MIHPSFILYHVFQYFHTLTCMHAYICETRCSFLNRQTNLCNEFFSIRQESMVFLFHFDSVCYEVSNEFLVFGKICCWIGHMVSVLKKNNTPLRIMSMYPLHHLWMLVSWYIDFSIKLLLWSSSQHFHTLVCIIIIMIMIKPTQ